MSDSDGLLEQEIGRASKLPAPAGVEQPPRKSLSWLKLRRLRKQLAEPKVLEEKGGICARKILLELGQSQDSRVLDLLTDHAKDHFTSIREGAITAIGELGDPAGVPTVLKTLLDRDADVLRAVFTALNKIGDGRVVRALLLFGLEKPEWKALANDTLVKLGPRVSPELFNILQTNNAGMTLEAIVVLGRIGDKRAVPALIACLDHVSNLLKAHVVEALALIGDSRATPQMLRALEDQSVAVRVNAAAGLVRMADPRSLRPLLRALQDHDADVRRFAVLAIGELDDEKAVPELIPILAAWEQLIELDPEFLEAMVETLGKLGDVQAVPGLIPLLQATHDGVLLKTVLALKHLRDPLATAALASLLKTPKPPLRRRVIESLGHSGDHSIVPTLGELLIEDASAEVRAAAARALGELGAKEAGPFLEAAVRDEVSVRCQAVIAMGTIREQSTLPALLAMLKDPAPEVRYHALNAVVRFQEPKTLKALVALLEDDNAMVRNGAARATEQFGAAVTDKRVKQIVTRVRRRERFARLIPSWTFLLVPRTHIGKSIVAAVVACSLLMPVVIKSVIGGPRRVLVRGNVQSLALNTDGSVLVAERTMGMLEVWNVNKQSVKQQADGVGFRLPLFDVKDRILLLSGENIVPWSLSGLPNVTQSWKGHKLPIDKFVVTPDGKFAATMSKDLVALAWDLESGRKKSEVEIGERFPNALTISPDGKRLASTNRLGAVSVVETETGKQIHELPGNKKAILALTFSRDGKRIAGFEQAGGLRVWELAETAETQSEKTIASKTSLSVIGLRFLNDSKRVLSVDAGGDVRLWNVEQADSRPVCSADVERVDGYALSGDERIIALGGSSSSAVLVYDIESGELIKTLDVRGR